MSKATKKIIDYLQNPKVIGENSIGEIVDYKSHELEKMIKALPKNQLYELLADVDAKLVEEIEEENADARERDLEYRSNLL